MLQSKRRSLDADPLDEAASWYAKLHSDSATEATWTEFLSWLESDPSHAVAFDRVEDVYEELDQAREPIAAELDQAGTIVALNAWRGLRRPLVFRATAGALGLLAASIVVAIGFGRIHSPNNSLAQYETRIGESKKISLADGSVVEMNTGSTLSVNFSKTQRLVRLDKGEAVFRVAKDSARPFVVTVGDREVRDLGTVYDVQRGDGQIFVTVTEGLVAVSPHTGQVQSADDLAVEVLPGEQLVFKDGAAKPAIHKIDTDAVLAWRNGYLTFTNAPMAQVAKDLNRYFADPIVFQDQEAASRPFSGVLKIDSEDAVLKRLTELMPVSAERSANGNIILRTKH
jgi:transmembrane sensor